MKHKAEVREQLLIEFPGDYVTVQWAAKALDYSRQRIMQLLEEGKLYGHQKGGERGWWKIRKSSVIELLQKRQQQEAASRKDDAE